MEDDLRGPLGQLLTQIVDTGVPVWSWWWRCGRAHAFLAPFLLSP